MQARTITLASLTLAGLCASFGSQAHAQPAVDPQSPAQPAAQPRPYPDPTAQPAYPQPYPGQPYQPQPYPAQPYPGQPYESQPYQAQPYQAQPYPAQPYQAQPYPAQPYPAQPSLPQPYPAQPSLPQPYQPQPAQPYYPPQPYAGQAAGPSRYNPNPTSSVRYVNRPRTGLIVGGVVTLGVAWSLSALGAAYAGSSCSSGLYGEGSCYDSVWPLFIPLVGPWMQMGNSSNSEPTTLAYLAFDGLVQAGGLVMIIAGAVTRSRVAIYAKNDLRVSPLMLGGTSGLLVSGRF